MNDMSAKFAESVKLEPLSDSLDACFARIDARLARIEALCQGMLDRIEDAIRTCAPSRAEALTGSEAE
jgi:hypothetical protein